MSLNSTVHNTFYKKLDRFLRRFNMQAYALIFIEIVVGAAVSVSSFLLFAKFASEVLEKEGLHLDTQLSQVVYSIRNPFLTDVMRFFSFIGGEALLFLTLIVLLWLFLKGYKREGIVFACAIGIGYLLNNLIKFLLKVPRPDIDPIALAHFYSFPSGHAMSSFIFFASVSYLVFHFTRKTLLSFTVAAGSAIIVLMIGFSRIYLGVHYPSDIVAGYIAGFWWVVTVIVLDKTLHFYRLFKTTRR